MAMMFKDIVETTASSLTRVSVIHANKATIALPFAVLVHITRTVWLSVVNRR